MKRHLPQCLLQTRAIHDECVPVRQRPPTEYGNVRGIRNSTSVHPEKCAEKVRDSDGRQVNRGPDDEVCLNLWVFLSDCIQTPTSEDRGNVSDLFPSNSFEMEGERWASISIDFFYRRSRENFFFSKRLSRLVSFCSDFGLNMYVEMR
jgi:hypothetical protein